MTEQPPPYEKSGQPGQGYPPLEGYSQPGQGYSQPGQGYNQPGQGYSQRGQGYSQPGQAFPPPYSGPVVGAIVFGKEPVNTVCRNCGANITTTTVSETGTMAYVMAGLMCAVGFWCCFCLPLAMDSLKDVRHSCPSCNSIQGVFKAKM